MLKLQFKDRRREAVWLVDKTFTIGKDSRNSLMINDPSVLDFHAEIINNNDQLTLMDKSAGKALKVNGQPVTSHRALKVNDNLRIGDLELELIDPKATSSPAMSAKKVNASSGWSISSNASWLEQGFFNINGKTVIGRDASCDISLPLEHLSRRHVELDIQGSQMVVKDLDSSNGTFLNGERITQATAKPGDKIKLDVVTFEVKGPSADPNKTIIRSAAPAANKKTAPANKPAKSGQSAANNKTGARAKPKTSPAKSRKSPPKKKLAADGKQDWISGDATELPAKESSGSKVTLIIIGVVVIGIGIFAATQLL